jgi:hypothetical protein
MEATKSDPWESLMNAGSGFDTFLLLLGPLLITTGLITLFAVFYYFHQKKRQKGFDDLIKSMPETETDINADPIEDKS